jgi:hypothetical protein
MYYVNPIKKEGSLLSFLSINIVTYCYQRQLGNPNNQIRINGRWAGDKTPVNFLQF